MHGWGRILEWYRPSPSRQRIKGVFYLNSLSKIKKDNIMQYSIMVPSQEPTRNFLVHEQLVLCSSVTLLAPHNILTWRIICLALTNGRNNWSWTQKSQKRSIHCLTGTFFNRFYRTSVLSEKLLVYFFVWDLWAFAGNTHDKSVSTHRYQQVMAAAAHHLLHACERTSRNSAAWAYSMGSTFAMLEPWYHSTLLFLLHPN